MTLATPRRSEGPYRLTSVHSGCRMLMCGTVMAAACATSAPPARDRSGPSRPAVVTTPNSVGEDIVVRTNAERKKLRVPGVARNAALMTAAQLHADQMAALGRMAHDLPGAAYPSLDDRLAAAGYRMRASGENVAEGYPSAAAVVAGWMTSPGHRSNILSAQFTEMGAGVATAKNGRRFYAQVFGSPR